MEAKIYHTLPREAKLIREEVFIREQGFQAEYDETDERATHIVMFDGDEAVAVCRVFEGEDPDTFVLGRLAVKKEYRGKGIGSQTVKAAEAYLGSMGAATLMLHSQVQAKEFYTKLGFEEFGEIEYEEDCPHIWMKKELL